MKEKKESIEFYPRNRQAWRNWLQKNHATKQSVWLIMYKKSSGKPTILYNEVVEEALCFGWIDSVPRKRDAESSFLYISVRKAKSGWSALNKTRIEKLLRENKMAAAGLQKIEAAKKDGSWSALDKIEALEMPAALQKALTRNKKALAHFNGFPSSVRKQLFLWVESAKTPVTKEKRITGIVTLAEKNIRANQWKPKS
ncbi:MAG TPA: YdeI/OmpD-associated family protein [Ferruginibacter sp.]|nr:YdeI/OmpD-associated family protein [Ferruginibacter sp.]HNA00183.1 YdeI/OmpD-associated family protein [Ferruginibacter sp.]HNH21451.1 YdeI/OmpD-associated family protein [Ferruginibacter sp.]HNJ94740.1 YdeI/OmpD-associated family protein [Ferruginibacter sp.]HNK28187.1 YdeI/OmpD-associated family protein [Ferruginibacter sp.]